MYAAIFAGSIGTAVPPNGIMGEDIRDCGFFRIPYYPVKTEWDTPYYSSFDVELFGPPDVYGVHQYFVIDNYRDDVDETTVMTKSDHFKPPPRIKKHVYDREQRFKWTLRVLLGASREPIPHEILYCFQHGDIDWNPKKVWSSIRQALKKQNHVVLYLDDEQKKVATQKYYNRIPEILRYHKYGKEIVIPREIDYENVYLRFKQLHYMFDHNDCPYCDKTFNKRTHYVQHLKKVHHLVLGRSYFPNLRYTVLRLLQEQGVEFEYEIPLLRTKRKLEGYEKEWSRINS
jgi:hypothetical protein